MKKLWLFLINTFEVNTRGSRRKMLQIANDHDARLDAAKADPDILALYTPFHAALLIYQTMMSAWYSSQAIGKGNTQSWEELLDEMSETWFDVWQGMVFGVYPNGTPEATAIFPQKKAPFQSTKYDVRMVAVEALHVTLLTYPALAAVATAVAAKLTLLRNARNQQQVQFGVIDFSSNDVEKQRLVMADLLDDNLGDLKKKYRPDMAMVENFFNLSLLRKSMSDSDATFQFSGAVEAGTTTVVIVSNKLTMSANASCTFTNNCNVAELVFFFSASASAADNPVKTTVLPNQSAEGTAAESGWAPGTNFIIVKNTGAVTAEFEGMVAEAVEG